MCVYIITSISAKRKNSDNKNVLLYFFPVLRILNLKILSKFKGVILSQKPKSSLLENAPHLQAHNQQILLLFTKHDCAIGGNSFALPVRSFPHVSGTTTSRHPWYVAVGAAGSVLEGKTPPRGPCYCSSRYSRTARWWRQPWSTRWVGVLVGRAMYIAYSRCCTESVDLLRPS